MRCYAQRSPAVARNYEDVRCGSVVRKNCQDVTAYAAGSLQECTSANHLECGLARARVLASFSSSACRKHVLAPVPSGSGVQALASPHSR